MMYNLCFNNPNALEITNTKHFFFFGQRRLGVSFSQFSCTPKSFFRTSPKAHPMLSVCIQNLLSGIQSKHIFWMQHCNHVQGGCDYSLKVAMTSFGVKENSNLYSTEIVSKVALTSFGGG